MVRRAYSQLRNRMDNSKFEKDWKRVECKCTNVHHTTQAGRKGESCLSPPPLEIDAVTGRASRTETPLRR